LGGFDFVDCFFFEVIVQDFKYKGVNWRIESLIVEVRYNAGIETR
jgi:hypothetical protein